MKPRELIEKKTFFVRILKCLENTLGHLKNDKSPMINKCHIP